MGVSLKPWRIKSASCSFSWYPQTTGTDIDHPIISYKYPPVAILWSQTQFNLEMHVQTGKQTFLFSPSGKVCNELL